MEQEKLNEILELHKKWLNGDANGISANLRGANLRGTNLCDACLRVADLLGADLRGADLSNANLRDAYLRGADLRGADLRGADLYCADLLGADLCNANLSGANLYEANLCSANLYRADLSNANLSGANLSGANLYEANLCSADLRDANLCRATLRGTKNVPYIPMECPSDGAFVGWKKVNKTYLIKLEIPEDAKRSSATTKKCRCNKAKVLGIYNLDGSETNIKSLVNENHVKTIYTTGEMVYPNSFDESRWNECSHGIHFFVNRQDAVNYTF